MTSQPSPAQVPGPTRTERDSMGEVEVPRDALYAAQTARAVQNFPISGRPVPAPIVHALALVKAVAAEVNAGLGALDEARARAIGRAAESVAAGEHDGQFPVDVFQTGSGTSTNMNVNEVVATLANRELDDDRRVHPNDHVNMGQSSNDVFPTAVRIAAVREAHQVLLPALEHLEASLRGAAERFTDVVKAGRTHLMDAVPVTLGQEFAGYARQVELGRRRVVEAAALAAELPLGGTATGTGLNAHPDFAARVVAEVSRRSGVDLTEAQDHFEAQSTQDALVGLSGALKVVAVSLTKICNDLRWMGSGPRAGLGELHLPDLQPGSSIMPGKVNPVVPEAVLMVCARVIGNDTTVTVAGASGNFELTVTMPVMGLALMESLSWTASASRLLADRCVDGLEADEEHCRTLAESSSAIVTALNPVIGYEAAAAVAKQSLAERRTIADVVRERGHVERGELSEEQLEQALDVLAMARPHD